MKVLKAVFMVFLLIGFAVTQWWIDLQILLYELDVPHAGSYVIWLTVLSWALLYLYLALASDSLPPAPEGRGILVVWSVVAAVIAVGSAVALRYCPWLPVTLSVAILTATIALIRSLVIGLQRKAGET